MTKSDQIFLAKNQSEMAVRPLSLHDVPLLAQLHSSCFRDDPWDEKNFREMLTVRSFFGFLAHLQEKPVGFILCNIAVDEIEIITFCILAPFRKKGYGQTLLEYLVEFAQQKAVKTIFLEVAENNFAAVTFYQSVGFAKISSRKRYYKNQIDANVMEYKVPNAHKI